MGQGTSSVHEMITNGKGDRGGKEGREVRKELEKKGSVEGEVRKRRGAGGAWDVFSRLGRCVQFLGECVHFLARCVHVPAECVQFGGGGVQLRKGRAPVLGVKG